MVKEAKNIDFYTTCREPSKDEFKRISEWILSNKAKANKASSRAGNNATSPNKMTKKADSTPTSAF